MVVARTRSERLRTWAAGSLAAVYVLGFLPLLLSGAGVYFEYWFGVQMVAGVAAVWLYPGEKRRRPSVERISAGTRSRGLVRAPRA